MHAAFLLAATVAAPATLPPRPPDATYAYAIQAGGVPLGNSTVVVDGSTAGTIVVKESASFSMPAAFTATTTMRYDAATLRETAYSADFVLPAGTQHTDVTVKPAAMTVTVPGSAGVDIPADPSAPLELVGDNLVASSVLVPAILHATGAKSFTLAVLSGAKPLVCKVVSDPMPSRPASVPATDVELALELASIRIIYWYDPKTYVVHNVAIPAQQAEYHLTSTK